MRSYLGLALSLSLSLAASLSACSGTSSPGDAGPDVAAIDAPAADVPGADALDGAMAVDAPQEDRVAPDVSGADAVMCPLPPIDTATCTTDSECATVARGCYCGMQPVVGVSTGYHDVVAQCEEYAASHCALGCVSIEGQVAEDGRSPPDGGTIAVRCAAVDAGARRCQTYVP